MLSLWEEITQLADFNKAIKLYNKLIILITFLLFQELLEEGKISVDEFKDAVQQCCMGKRYEHLPQALKMFIGTNITSIFATTTINPFQTQILKWQI